MALSKKFVEKIDNPSIIAKLMKGWVEDRSVSEIFRKINLDKNYFISYFGLKILDYFILVFSGKAEIGSCPYVEKFVDYLEEHHVSVGDVFLICSGLKKSIIDFVLEDKDFTIEEKKQLFDEIYAVFDMNLAGVLNKFVG